MLIAEELSALGADENVAGFGVGGVTSMEVVKRSSDSQKTTAITMIALWKMNNRNWQRSEL